MKNFCTLIITLLMASAAMTQTDDPCESCLPEGIWFASQAQIDNFQINNLGCTEIEGGVDIGGYAWTDITNLDSLIVINSIGGALKIGYGIPGGHNPYLTSLSGLQNLTSIGSNLTISSNYVLTSLQGLESLTSIGGELFIVDNDALESLAGLDNIDGGTILDLYISNNSSLSICESKWLCEYLANPSGSINIYNNASGCNGPPEIASDCGISMPCLRFGNYCFYSQDGVDSFQADYPGCTDLEGDVNIFGSDINNLFGLNTVISIDGGLYFFDNDVLTNLGGLENLTSIGGTLQFRKNSALVSLMGMDGLSSIGGSFILGYSEGMNGGNPALTSLMGMDGLTSLGGRLIILDNDALTSLSGLDNLTSVGDRIRIVQNNALTSLSGLDNIETSTIEDLSIAVNFSLSTCEVESVCAYLANPNGSIEIQINAIGCNSPEEVLDSCEANAVKIGELDLLQNISIFPNPTHSTITIELQTETSNTTTLTISNTNGQQLITQPITEPQTEIDISHLPVGIYIVKVWSDKEVMVGKVIKQ